MAQAEFEPINESEVIAFDMYFGSLVGMNEHPGKNREGGHRMTTEGCAAKAIEMILIRRTLIPRTFSHESK